MENSYVFAFLFLFHFSPGGAYDTYCSSGERLHTPRVGHDVCIPCHHGTFIDEENHSFRQCKLCTVIQNPDVEMLASACNSTHDSVILCTIGFYRRRARNVRQKDRCVKCTECLFPARPCEGYYNTVCCPPNHDAVLTPEGVFVCKERPIVCGAGQFFRTSSEECLPCPAGTFMSDHSHTYKDCLKCEELSENNLTQAAIIRPCSRTAPTLFGCKAGYFRDPTQESLQIEVPCTPCRICNRRLTDCGMIHDAVCDDKDRMVPTAPTNHTVSIGDENGSRNTPPETSMKQLHDTQNDAENSLQSNKNDSELPSSTERLDTDFVWILLLTCVTLLLLGTILLILIIFLKKQSNLTGGLKYDNMLHQCGHSKLFVHKIMLFALISHIVLLIFQVLVTFGAIKPTPSALMAFKLTVTCLSILVLAANVIIYCTYLYITKKSRRRLPDGLASEQFENRIFVPEKNQLGNVCYENGRMYE